MLVLASSEAHAQVAPSFDIKAAVKSIEADSSQKPLGGGLSLDKPVPTAVANAITARISANHFTVPATAVTVALPASSGFTASQSRAGADIAKEAAWLHRNGWPLYALVDRYGAGAPLNDEQNCMAVAVYHEARGETLEGQLAVARVIMNRAASGRYPGSWCGVVKQPWQFSFVNPRTGQYPMVNTNSAAWRKALAISRLAISDVVPSLSRDVLWYHADYVAPSWGRRLSFVQKIGTHMFYRS